MLIVFSGQQAVRLTGALLDRLTHHAHLREFIGESYRFRQRQHQAVNRPLGPDT
jgi:DNA replication protein DnaC